MKTFFLVGSVLFTVFILIVAFQNSDAVSGFQVLFTELNINGTLIIFGVALLGMCAGAFYYGFLNAVLKSGEEEELPGGIS